MPKTASASRYSTQPWGTLSPARETRDQLVALDLVPGQLLALPGHDCLRRSADELLVAELGLAALHLGSGPGELLLRRPISSAVDGGRYLEPAAGHDARRSSSASGSPSKATLVLAAPRIAPA